MTPLENFSRVPKASRNGARMPMSLCSGMHSPTGFTLIETVITVALTAAIMLVIANLYLNFNTLHTYQQSVVATGNAATNATDAIQAAVLPSDSVVASHSFSGVVVNTGANALVLEVPSMNASGDIISNTHDYIAFYLAGTDLYRRVDAGAGSARPAGLKKIATAISSLTFAYDTADVTQATYVSVGVVASITGKNGVVQTSLSGKYYLRNK